MHSPTNDWYREVGISSGNQALTRCAFFGSNPTDESITSGLPVTRSQSAKRQYAFGLSSTCTDDSSDANATMGSTHLARARRAVLRLIGSAERGRGLHEWLGTRG